MAPSLTLQNSSSTSQPSRFLPLKNSPASVSARAPLRDRQAAHNRAVKMNRMMLLQGSRFRLLCDYPDGSACQWQGETHFVRITGGGTPPTGPFASPQMYQCG